MPINKSQFIATIRATKIRNEDGKQMLIALAEMMDDDRIVRKALSSAERMAKRCGIGELTARKYLLKLREANLIKIVKRKRLSWYQLANEETISKLI